MFAKPYKLKSNTTLKNSEKKHLAQRIQDEFPSTTEEKVKELVPVKSSCICMKMVLHSGDSVNVYSVDGAPVLVEAAEGLVPTVCALWKVPDLVPLLTVHTPVLSKVQGGAPLYLPGLEIPAGGVGFPQFTRGTIIAMCTHDNAAAAIVGRAAISSADMLLRATGVCLETIQVFGDQLCKDNKFGKIERPVLGPANNRPDPTTNLSANVAQLSIQPVIKEEWPSLGRAARAPPDPLPPPPTAAPPPNQPTLIADTDAHHIQQNADQQEEEDTEDSMITEGSRSEQEVPEDMDGLLRWSLLSFLKRDAARADLPLKTNLLYKNHLLALCPEDRTLDVKKSSYKKLGKFLEAMQEEGLVEVRELDKGVDAVVALNASHPLVRAHRAPRAARAAPSAREPEREHDYAPPLVREMFCVTAAVVDLFAPLKKGTALTPGEVRAALAEHVKLRAPRGAAACGAAAPGHVLLDPLLARILGKQEQEAVRWDALAAGVRARMTPATEMRFADGDTRLSKARLEPVTVQVATRSGNKKVTLVSNLEAFGFSLPALSRACQLGAAASCRVTRSPGARRDQLLLQGDQTHFVAKLLIEKYGLPKKFMEGADKALNKKNK